MERQYRMIKRDPLQSESRKEHGFSNKWLKLPGPAQGKSRPFSSFQRFHTNPLMPSQSPLNLQSALCYSWAASRSLHFLSRASVKMKLPEALRCTSLDAPPVATGFALRAGRVASLQHHTPGHIKRFILISDHGILKTFLYVETELAELLITHLGYDLLGCREGSHSQVDTGPGLDLKCFPDDQLQD